MTLTKTTQPKKQRKRKFRSPMHIRRRSMSSGLSQDLRNKHGLSRVPIREGDMVYVMSGNFRGTEGKVSLVKGGKIQVEGITREKADGSKAFYPLEASKVRIVRFGKLDSWRRKLIRRKAVLGAPLLEEEGDLLEDIQMEEE